MNRWKAYLAARGLTNGESPATFPEKYDVAHRDDFYSSLSVNGWGGSCGHDSTMIAYVFQCFLQLLLHVLCVLFLKF